MKGEALRLFISLTLFFWIQNLQVCRSHHATCDRTYSKVDCVHTYQNRKRIYNELVITDRDSGSPKASGIPTDWAHWEEYLLGLVCRCSEKLNRMSDGNITLYNQFTIENYGECWSTRYGYLSLHTLTRSNNCIGAGYLNCLTEGTSECTGIHLSSFLYQIHNRSKLLDKHCHIERRIVCPSSILAYNSFSPSQVVKSSKFVINSTSIFQNTPSQIESTHLATSSNLSQATRKKFSSVDTTLYESKLSNQTLNTGQLYTSGSKLPNITLAPTRFMIVSSRNTPETAKLSIVESTRNYHSSSQNLTRSPETNGSLEVRTSRQISISTKTLSQGQATNESYHLSKEPTSTKKTSFTEPSTNETTSTQPSTNETISIQPSTKETNYIQPSSKEISSIGHATNSETIFETSRLNFGLSSIKTNPIEAIPTLISQVSQNPSTENNNQILSSISRTLLLSSLPWQPNITSLIATASQDGDTTSSLPMSYKSKSNESKVGYISTTQTVYATLSVVPVESPDAHHLSPSTNANIHKNTIRFSESSGSSLSRDIPTLSKALSNMTQNIIIESLLKSSLLFGNTSTKNLITESLSSKSFEESSNVDSIQTQIPGNHSSIKQETRETSMTPWLNSTSTHVTMEILKSTTSPSRTKSLNMTSMTQFNERSVSPTTLEEVIPTSFSAQQGSSSRVEGTTSAMQRSISNQINTSYENKISLSSDFKSILDDSILHTVKSKPNVTTPSATITTLTSSFMSRNSESFRYITSTGETSSSKSQPTNLFSSNYHVTKSLNYITSGNLPNESTSHLSQTRTLPKTKPFSVGKSSSVTPSTQPTINCTNTESACKKNSGTNVQLSTLLELVVIQLTLTCLVSLSA